MNANEFRQWRVDLGLEQGEAAEKLGRTRMTIYNWENGRVEIPEGIEHLCKEIARRVHCNDPAFGPVILSFSEKSNWGGQFSLRQNLRFPNNVAMIEKVRELWDGGSFHNPLVQYEDGELLWRQPDLRRAITGE